MGTFFSVLGWVLLGLLAAVILLIVFLLFFPSAVRISYRKNELKASVRLLIFTVPVYPTESDGTFGKRLADAVLTQDRKHRGLSAQPASAQTEQTTEGALKNYLELLDVFRKHYLPHFYCKKFLFHLAVGGDPMDVALTCGTVNTLLAPLIAGFSAAGKLKKADATVTPDFTSEQTRFEADTVFHFRLVSLLKEFFRF